MAHMDKPKVFFPNLDGLRFFAFLSVFLSHCIGYLGYTNPSRIYTLLRHFFANGDLGVNFFFVLSGFLITFLLYKEFEAKKTIHVRYFYLRRFFRIWPVFFLIVFIGFFIIPHTHFVTEVQSSLSFSIKADLKRLPWFIFFLANFDLVFNREISFIVIGLWSVSVEEQFYLIWPVIINYLRPKNLKTLLWVMIGISFIYRCLNSSDSITINYSSLSVMSDICTGALIAHYTLSSDNFVRKFTNLKKRQILLIYFTGFLLMPLRGFAHIFGETLFHVYIPFESLLFSAFFAFIVLEQNFSVNSIIKVGRSKILSYFGKISYGLYCYHMLAMTLCASLFLHLDLRVNNALNFSLLIFSSFLLTLLLAFISFIVLEKRLINFKEKYALFRK
jgi:peptidoglycan/LPS O-acetylase OafA/YrhL